MRNKNITLVGFMGTGKTAVAQELARHLERRVLVKLDDMIEKEEGMTINEIFSKKGEPYFRRLEKEMVKKVSRRRGLIIDPGGGVVLDKENMDNLKRNGIVICLTARPQVILERTERFSHRPLLNVRDPKSKIEELLKARAPFYAQSDYTVDTSDLTVQDVVKRILDILKRCGA
jgi:shikimate kinase